MNIIIKITPDDNVAHEYAAIYIPYLRFKALSHQIHRKGYTRNKRG
ncbi:hypothetical protein ES705_08207 [subsurface metagenome]